MRLWWMKSFECDRAREWECVVSLSRVQWLCYEEITFHRRRNKKNIKCFHFWGPDELWSKQTEKFNSIPSADYNNNAFIFIQWMACNWSQMLNLGWGEAMGGKCFSSNFIRQVNWSGSVTRVTLGSIPKWAYFTVKWSATEIRMINTPPTPSTVSPDNSQSHRKLLKKFHRNHFVNIFPSK